MPKTCNGCVYWLCTNRGGYITDMACDYISIAGKMRPCKTPGPGLRCELYQQGEIKRRRRVRPTDKGQE